LLNALALGITDAFDDACRVEGLDGTEATALIALLDIAHAGSIRRLSFVLGVTHSGAVRVADRLETRGWITRAAVRDLRSVELRLTPAGRQLGRRMRRHREDASMHVLAGLASQEQAVLTAAVESMLARVVAHRLELRTEGLMPSGGALCRRCDFAACGRASGRCPAQAATSST